MKVISSISILILISFFLPNPAFTQESISLKVGDKAPVFSAPDDNNKSWKIEKYLGKKNIVIYFYPNAMGTNCTKQACAYSDNYLKLQKQNAIAVGICGDEVENLRIFSDAYNLNFPLLSDKTGEIARKFGVPVGEGNSIKREINGKEIIMTKNLSVKRWTFIINTSGNIIHINQEVNAAKDSKEVLKILRAEK